MALFNATTFAIPNYFQCASSCVRKPCGPTCFYMEFENIRNYRHVPAWVALQEDNTLVDQVSATDIVDGEDWGGVRKEKGFNWSGHLNPRCEGVLDHMRSVNNGYSPPYAKKIFDLVYIYFPYVVTLLIQDYADFRNRAIPLFAGICDFCLRVNWNIAIVYDYKQKLFCAFTTLFRGDNSRVFIAPSKKVPLLSLMTTSIEKGRFHHTYTRMNPRDPKYYDFDVSWGLGGYFRYSPRSTMQYRGAIMLSAFDECEARWVTSRTLAAGEELTVNFPDPRGVWANDAKGFKSEWASYIEDWNMPTKNYMERNMRAMVMYAQMRNYAKASERQGVVGKIIKRNMGTKDMPIDCAVSSGISQYTCFFFSHFHLGDDDEALKTALKESLLPVKPKKFATKRRRIAKK